MVGEISGAPAAPSSADQHDCVRSSGRPGAARHVRMGAMGSHPAGHSACNLSVTRCMDQRPSGEPDGGHLATALAWDLCRGCGMEDERRFPLDPTSVRRARTFVVAALAGAAADEEVVCLLTSELATNAVLHAESDFRVRLHADASIVRVEVINTEPELLLAMRESSAQGGRGLHLVKELSADWGADSFRDEKVVWFEVPASGAETPRGA